MLKLYVTHISGVVVLDVQEITTFLTWTFYLFISILSLLFRCWTPVSLHF